MKPCRLLLLTALSLIPLGCASDDAGEASSGQKGVTAKADPEMAAVLTELQGLKGKPIENLSAAKARRQPTPADAVTQLMQKKGNVAPQPMPAMATIEMRNVPGPGGAQIPVRVYTPKGQAPFPVVVYYHGGGWVIADLDTYDASARALADGVKAVVVSVDYRQAPEHKFPAAHEDSYAALQHVMNNAPQFGGDPDRVAVAGESAGGNLATAVCLMAPERGGKTPVHQLLVYPIADYAFDTASYRENANAKPLNAAMMKWFFHKYLGSPSDGQNVLVSPLRANEDVLAKLPPATVITAEIDPLRSEGQAYARKLKRAGVDVAVRDFTGVTHEFFGMGAVVPDAKEAQQFAARRLRQALKVNEATAAAEKPAQEPEAQQAAAAPRGAGGSGAVTTTVTAGGPADADKLSAARGGPAQGKRSEQLQTIAVFPGKAMPTGVTVAEGGRIFLSFPRWGDPVEYTAVELRDGKLVPFPDAKTNAFYPDDVGRANPAEHLVSVQSVVADGRGRVWLLDPGSVNLGPNIPGAAKLWGYDLSSGKRVKAITFPTDVALKKTYLNDVRFDLNRGDEGTAYITDSGAGGIIVVDLASGAPWRHLDNHPSVKSAIGVQFTSEGRPFLMRKPNGEEMVPDIRSDGIALSPDGKTLYYNPLMSRDVYSVPTDMLADKNADPQKVAAAVKKVATKPSANDGLLCDAQGRIYATDWEDNAIRRIDPQSGNVEVVVQDERLLWPDTLAMLGNDLYVVSNQLARQKQFHQGRDLREPPYVLFKITIDGKAKEGATR